MLQSLKFLNKENNERAYFLSFDANFCLCFLQKLSKNGRKMSIWTNFSLGTCFCVF
ncbi:MAG: hypothetical protein MR769_06735 [Campylobacter sp.]|uniref:hypothetical protein n=1 Tax=Campylobacter sp. TaxID=205 RepID=UPI002AA82D97|nr:hypothetical protein [Campylobacter sp.]MCI6344364.1 hypothetical protein [Campylobacter sp.]